MPASGRGSRRSPPPRRSWGWHPLRDDWARRIVADAAIGPGDLVLDIGAGAGALTRPLLAAGAHVIAIELHPQRVRKLDALREGAPRLTVVRADASDLRLPRRPFRVVANPPFAITSAVVSRLLAPGSRLVAADLVLQRAAARRWIEGRAPGAMRWGREFDLRAGPTVPRRAFTPEPPVDAVVLRLRRR